MFMIYCDNRGCGRQTAALLDPDDGKAYCADCDRPITAITSIAKNQLKSFKQIRRKKETYAFKCGQCGIEARPALLNDKLVCPRCKTPSTGISKPFETLVRDAIKGDEAEESE